MISTALLAASACVAGVAEEGEEGGPSETAELAGSGTPAAIDGDPGAETEVDKAICFIRPDRTNTQTVYSGFWGNWGCPEFCPPNSFAYGINLKGEPSQGSDDDTALNAVSLHCYDRDTFAFTGYAVSSEGPWGNWYSEGTPARCPSRDKPIVAARVRSEGKLSSGDDTVLNDVGAKCQDNTLLEPVSPTSWGTLTGYATCDAGSAVCGITTRLEPPQGSGDDTALNGIKLECCKLCPRNQVYCDGVCKAASQCSVPPIPR